MGYASERAIRKTLRKLAKQRVGLVLQPGNCWVIEFAVEDTKETDVALKTCHMRGWVEPLTHAIPSAALPHDGKLLPNLEDNFTKLQTLYRLTDSGWAVIHHVQGWLVTSVILALLAVITAFLTLEIAIKSIPH